MEKVIPTMEDIVIVGAGVAGLACMNALLDCGAYPLLIEAGSIGTSKLCGEFLSPTAVEQLEKWGIGPIQNIQEVSVFSKNTKLHIPQIAGAMSRSDAELQLFERAKKLGGKVVENTKIQSVLEGQVFFADGTCHKPKQLVIATGRLGVKPTHFPYIGLKAHFLHDEYTPKLEMHLFKGGYYGIIPVSPTTSNVACLVKKKYYNQALQKIKKHLNQELDWLTAPISEFGHKTIPSWPNTFWIGDAIAALPPAIGGGFGHAIHSSLLAAHHLVNNDPTGYKQELEHHLKSQMMWAKLLHYTMLWPTLHNIALGLLDKAPNTTLKLLEKIGLRG